MASPRVGIIGGRKASDAALCQAITTAFPGSIVVHYQIPIRAWIPWIWRRVRERGLATLLGHLALSTYLRAARVRDRLLGRSLWRNIDLATPSWRGVATQSAWSEEQVISAVADCDIIVMLDAFRVSHRFFRQLRKPCLQVIWGNSPLYMGDSGAFWAFALGDRTRVGASIVLRSTQFSTISIITSLSIAITEEDSLRSIKVKQVAKLATHLPTIIAAMTTRKPFITDRRAAVAYHYYAPTLWTYLRIMSTGPQHALPAYARREQPCMLITLSL